MNPAQILNPRSDGFRGFLYCPDAPTTRCMVILAGDDGNDFLSQAFARWFIKYQGCSALCISLRQDPALDPGLSLFNLNILSAAASWLRQRDYGKIGICGISMQAVIALSAAARIPDYSLCLAFSPCDYVPWGFRHGPIGKSKNAEYPTGMSLLTWKGRPLPFQEAHLSRGDYWEQYRKDSRKYHEPHSKGIFDHSEEVERIPLDAFIPAEQIRGAVILVGAEDDSMWNSTRYIHRLRRRLREQEFIFPVKYFTYGVGTHLLLPRRMLSDALPLLSDFVSLLYASGRHHPFKCRAARVSLDEKLTSYLQCW